MIAVYKRISPYSVMVLSREDFNKGWVCTKEDLFKEESWRMVKNPNNLRQWSSEKKTSFSLFIPHELTDWND